MKDGPSHENLCLRWWLMTIDGLGWVKMVVDYERWSISWGLVFQIVVDYPRWALMGIDGPFAHGCQ